MNQTILDTIPFKIDFDALLEQVHIRIDDDDAIQLRYLAAQAEAIARPKAAYQLSFVDDKAERQVVVDGIIFTSRVLRINLDNVHRVFPYIATCGMEVETWSNTFVDMLERYWADIIKQDALLTANTALIEHFQAHYMPGTTATMNPGSLPDWPISEQKSFFRLMGEAPAAIGVTLSSTCLMTPNKSTTGLLFSTETFFINCQLCPRPDCPGRRAPYDESLYRERYGMAAVGSD